MNLRCLSFLAVIAALVVSPALAVDPVIHYTFDGSLANSGTGGSIYDAQLYTTIETVGGTATGSSAYVSGQVGQALDFTNVLGSNYGTFAAVEYTMPEQGTIALWYQTDSSGFYNYEPIFDSVEAIAAPGESNTYNGNAWEAWIYSDGVLRGRMDALSTYTVSTYDADLNPTGSGEWYHIAVSWDKNGVSDENLKLYVNGQLTGVSALAWTDPGSFLCFGGGSTANDVATGTYDDIRIYDSVVSATEIATLAGASGPVSIPQPVIHYGFEGDLSNSGTAGSAFNGVHVDGSTGDLSYTTGVSGQAISYDNLQDVATDGDFVRTNYTLADEGAISVWVKPTVSFNYAAIWDNSVQQDDWECWIYEDSRIRARIDNGSGDAQVSLAAIQAAATGSDAGWENEWYQVTYTWSKEKGIGSLYVNGMLVDVDAGAWIEPGEFFLGGGHDGNEYSLASFDELMIFEEYLTSAQAQAMYDGSGVMVPEPGTASLVLIGLLSLVGITWRKRG